MRTYDEARALVGQKLQASSTNGRTKWITFTEFGPSVRVTLIGTTVAEFRPEGVRLYTDGWVTPTTFDGIAAALDVQRVFVGTRKREPYVFDYRMSEGMLIGHDGRLIEVGSEETPLSDPRPR